VSLSLTRVLQTYADAFLIITICFAIATADGAADA
jgi:hypothetical protein